MRLTMTVDYDMTPKSRAAFARRAMNVWINAGGTPLMDENGLFQLGRVTLSGGGIEDLLRHCLLVHGLRADIEDIADDTILEALKRCQ